MFRILVVVLALSLALAIPGSGGAQTKGKVYDKAQYRSLILRNYRLAEATKKGSGLRMLRYCTVRSLASIAARDGKDPVAMWALADLYTFGKGVRQDRPQAYMWIILARRNGAILNARQKSIVAANFTPADRTEGTKLADQWSTLSEKEKERFAFKRKESLPKIKASEAGFCD